MSMDHCLRTKGSPKKVDRLRGRGCAHMESRQYLYIGYIYKCEKKSDWMAICSLIKHQWNRLVLHQSVEHQSVWCSLNLVLTKFDKNLVLTKFDKNDWCSLNLIKKHTPNI